MKNLITAAALALALFIPRTAPAQTFTVHNLDLSYPQITQGHISIAGALVTTAYAKPIPGDLTIYIIEDFLLKEEVLAFYDNRGPLIYIKASALESTISTLYVLAHELGHHILSGYDADDHCLMYSLGGYDWKILRALGLTNEEITEHFIGPFRQIFACPEY